MFPIVVQTACSSFEAAECCSVCFFAGWPGPGSALVCFSQTDWLTEISSQLSLPDSPVPRLAVPNETAAHERQAAQSSCLRTVALRRHATVARRVGVRPRD